MNADGQRPVRVTWKDDSWAEYTPDTAAVWWAMSSAAPTAVTPLSTLLELQQADEPKTVWVRCDGTWREGALESKVEGLERRLAFLESQVPPIPAASPTPPTTPTQRPVVAGPSFDLHPRHDEDWVEITATTHGVLLSFHRADDPAEEDPERGVCLTVGELGQLYREGFFRYCQYGGRNPVAADARAEILFCGVTPAGGSLVLATPLIGGDSHEMLRLERWDDGDYTVKVTGDAKGGPVAIAHALRAWHRLWAYDALPLGWDGPSGASPGSVADLAHAARRFAAYHFGPWTAGESPLRGLAELRKAFAAGWTTMTPPGTPDNTVACRQMAAKLETKGMATEGTVLRDAASEIEMWRTQAEGRRARYSGFRYIDVHGDRYTVEQGATPGVLRTRGEGHIGLTSPDELEQALLAGELRPPIVHAIDVTAMAAAMAMMTGGEWRASVAPSSGEETIVDAEHRVLARLSANMEGMGNARGLVALRNAAPELLRLLTLIGGAP